MKARTLGDRIGQERRLRSVQEWRDIGHQEIADAVGVSQPTYSRYERDETKPDDDTLGRLADYFGVTRSWLRFGEGSKHPAPAEIRIADPTKAPARASIPKKRAGER